MNKRRIILLGVLVFGVVGAFLLLSLTPAATPTLETAVIAQDDEPEQIDLSADLVSAEGEILPVRFVNQSFLIGGTVAEILVEENSIVSAGDPLLRLDSTNQELGIAQAEAGLAAAEAALAAAQEQLNSTEAAIATAQLGVTAAEAALELTIAGPRPEEIAAAEQNIAAAEAGVVQAAGNRDAALQIPASQIRAAEANVAAQIATVEALQEQYDAIIDACFTTPDGNEICPLYGPVEEAARAQLEEARLRLDAAQGQLNRLNAGATPAQRQAAGGSVAIAQASVAIAEANLALLLAGPTAEQVRQAEVRVEQAGAAVTIAEADLVRAQAAVSQAEAGVVTAQANLDAANAALARATITAAFDGTVATINVELGELVSPGAPILTVADLSAWTVETTDLTELDVVSLSEGDTVSVSVDAIPEETIAGTVVDIARVSELTRGDVTYDVVIELEERADLPLRWGMTVFVDVDN